MEREPVFIPGQFTEPERAPYVRYRRRRSLTAEIHQDRWEKLQHPGVIERTRSHDIRMLDEPSRHNDFTFKDGLTLILGTSEIPSTFCITVKAADV